MLNTLIEIVHNICTAIVVYAIYVSIKNNKEEKSESEKD